MTDQFSLCMADFKAQLQTLSNPYFPANIGRAAGWQVSENDLTPMEGGDYFIVLRPGSFTQQGNRDVDDNEWHVLATLYMRFSEYDSLWSLYRAFRSDVIALKKTQRLRAHGIWDQTFTAQGEPGFIVDTKTGAYTDLVAQTLDVTIKQRVKLQLEA